MERQLSRLFHSAVGDPPQQVNLSGIRRVVVRRRIITSITATTGIALAGLAGLAVSAPAIGTVPARHPGSRPAKTGTTVTDTVQSSAGTMTVQVKYRDQAHSKITIIITGKTKALKKHATIVVDYPVADNPTWCLRSTASIAHIFTVRVDKSGDFAASQSQPHFAIGRIGEPEGCDNGTLRVRLQKFSGRRLGSKDVIMTVGLLLTR